MVIGTPALAQDVEVDDGNGNTQNGNTTNDDGIQGSFYDLLDIIITDSSADQDNDHNGSYNGNSIHTVVAKQSLSATNTNYQMDELVDLDGEDGTPAPVGYNSGDNYVRGNAFAAFAGISNNAWNTGINANTQAATNIAAQGSVQFGVNGDAGAGGGGGGD
jgi:hypothetical protein